MDKDFDEIVSKVDFVFCAVNMPKDQIKAIEERYAKAEVPVVSNNSANRWTPDVPMVVPEINPEHLEVLNIREKDLVLREDLSVLSLTVQSRATHLLLMH